MDLYGRARPRDAFHPELPHGPSTSPRILLLSWRFITVTITPVQRPARLGVRQQHVRAQLARTAPNAGRLRRADGAARCPERSDSGGAPRRVDYWQHEQFQGERLCYVLSTVFQLWSDRVLTLNSTYVFTSVCMRIADGLRLLSHNCIPNFETTADTDGVVIQTRASQSDRTMS